MQADFDSLDAYNDYLEEVEDISMLRRASCMYILCLRCALIFGSAAAA